MEKRLSMLLIVIVLCIGTALAQNTVSGSVVSQDDGQPVTGATVIVEGTHLGTTTNSEGHFTLSVPSLTVTLKISYLGMNTETVQVGGKSNIQIKLSPQNKTLDDVVVVAYGTTQKSSYTGSASFIKSDKIKDVPVTSFENALTGKVAGLQITNSSGQLGETPSLRIRGIGSMNASNDPLYVIDGVPVVSGNVGQMSSDLYVTNNIMNSLNPEDIESISVLKDAAASALYGSRAANGVILITTKKGKSGKPKVNVKMTYGFSPSWATKNYEPASVQDQVNMMYQVYYDANYNADTKNDAEASSTALKWLNESFNMHGYQLTAAGTGRYQNINIGEYDNSGRGGKYYDWEKAYFRSAAYQNYDFSVSGGNGTTNYYSSLSYSDQQGRSRANDFKRASGRVNLMQKAGKFFDFTTNVAFSRTRQEGFNDTRNTATNYFFDVRNLLWGMYWPTDYKTGQPYTDRYESYAYNNLYYDKLWSNYTINSQFSAMETVALHPIPRLDIKSILSYETTGVKGHLYYSPEHYDGASTNGSVTETRSTYDDVTSSTTANYNLFSGDHELNIMAGFEAEKVTTDYTRAAGTNLANSDLQSVSIAGAYDAAGYKWGHSLLSVLSKADYNFNQTYYLSASYRRDGSSRLSKDNRWGNFWSVSAAWDMAKEKFMKPLTWLSAFKLRVSYGVNGTLPTDDYGYMSLMTYDSQYMGKPGSQLSTLASSNLSWETSQTTNIGIDFGLFRQRIRGTVEYYTRNSKNLLQDVPISLVTGFSSVLKNVGLINNHGIEVQLDGDVISNKNWLWTLSLNASFLSSKVKKLYDGQDIIWEDPTGDDGRAQFIYREGQSTLAFYGYEWAGVDKSNGNSVYYVNDPSDPKKGDFIYNGRGATYDYKSANYTIIGSAIPAVSGGFSSDLKYKSFDLNLNFIYKIGGKLYDAAYKDVADDGYYWARIRAASYYKDMWTPDNPNGTQPRLQGTDLTDAMQYSSRHISNASFLRLKNLSFGYTLPSNLLQRVFISNARLFFTASNLLTWAKYKEADPEVNQYGTRGWETPISKTFTFGIDLTF